jgi:hypothetical protein
MWLLIFCLINSKKRLNITENCTRTYFSQSPPKRYSRFTCDGEIQTVRNGWFHFAMFSVCNIYSKLFMVFNKSETFSTNYNGHEVFCLLQNTESRMWDFGFLIIFVVFNNAVNLAGIYIIIERNIWPHVNFNEYFLHF